MRSLLRLCLCVAACGLAACLAQAPGQSPSQAPKNLQVLPKDSSRAEVVATMRTIAASLGVKCSFCHVQGDFAKDDKDTKKTARRMLRMVDAINTQNFDGRHEVSCYTCHRGAIHPVSQVPPPSSGASGARDDR